MANQSKQQVVVWWVLWGAFQIGIFMFHRFLGGAAPKPETPVAESANWLAGFAPFALSTVIRWLVLPRVRAVQSAFLLFIVGMAMAETTYFMGLFIFRGHETVFLVVSALGIFQFIPYFAGRYFAGDDVH